MREANCLPLGEAFTLEVVVARLLDPPHHIPLPWCHFYHGEVQLNQNYPRLCAR